MKKNIIESDDKTFDTPEEMFKDIDKEFKNNHPIKYWIDYSLFLDKGFFGYAPHHFFTHPWIAIEFVSQEIRWAWQRVFKGFDERIIWSIDWYLAEKIPLWVQRLKETKHGTPYSMFTDQQLSNPEGISNEATDMAREKWNIVLDKIILGFESYHKIQEESLYEKDPEFSELNKNYEVGFDLFKEHFKSLWD